MNDELQARIRREVADQNVKHIQLWFTDILGSLKMVEIPDRQLDSVLESGAPFDGSSITGYAEIEESDIVAMPDWTTLKILPWAQGQEKTAFVFCDVLNRDYKPFEGDPRYVLRRQLKRAADMGLTFFVGPELEYFYFKDSDTPELVDEGGYFSVLPADLGNDLRKQTMRTLDKLGIPMEASHHEVAPSQHEIDPHYDEALVMADRVMISRLIVKEVAAHNGLHATFMPKPLHGENGSGMHVHQSLFRGEQNAFFSEDDPDHLSDLAKGFIAGQLKHMREICPVLNQWVNSFKRLVPGFEAPVYISWAHRNRTALIRVPLYIKGRESSVRAEMRNPDPACNPYLAFAVMLAAGLEGIEQRYDLPPSVEPNIYKMNAVEREAIGLEALPNNLYEAIQATQQSELVQRTLGDHIFERFITNKLNEWYEYREQVTSYELQRYLSVL
ncbi:MAG: glutamine synthetase [Actinobacteria bacterium]|nr:glutamine synthetase [Actinomycetota bacterium]